MRSDEHKAAVLGWPRAVTIPRCRDDTQVLLKPPDAGIITSRAVPLVDASRNGSVSGHLHINTLK